MRVQPCFTLLELLKGIEMSLPGMTEVTIVKYFDDPVGFHRTGKPFEDKSKYFPIDHVKFLCKID